MPKVSILIGLVMLQACVATKTPNPLPTAAPTAQSKTCLGIVSGIPDASDQSVWMIGFLTPDGTQLAGQCSGVFVSANTLLTASHCLPCDTTKSMILLSNAAQVNAAPTATEFSAILATAPTTTNYASAETAMCEGNAPQGTVSSLSTLIAKDLAVLVFGSQPGTSFVKIDNTHKPASTSVALIGYGLTGQDSTAASGTAVSKLIGQNTLIAHPSATTIAPGIYEIIGPANGGASQNALPAQGDAGGPLLSGGNLIGINADFWDETEASGQITSVYGQSGLGQYVDLNGAAATSLFASAASTGAVFTYAAGDGPGTGTAAAGGSASAATATATASGSAQNNAAASCP